MLQLGLCAHIWDTEANLYKAKPYNIDISPVANRVFQYERNFLTQASCLKFLLSKNFDLKKCLDYGVQYLTPEEEAQIRSVPQINVDNIEAPNALFRQYVANSKKLIQDWLDDTDDNKWSFVNLPTKSRGEFNLLQKLVRTEFPQLRILKYWDFAQVEEHPDGAAVARTEEGERDAVRKKEMERQFGCSSHLRKIFDEISKWSKPVVGHNVMMDLAHICQCFLGPLPDKFSDFKKMLLSLSPMIIDTKYLALYHPMLKEHFATCSSLEHVLKWTQLFGFRKISYTMDREFARHSWILHQHQAGYDARDTGLVFLALMWYIKNGPFNIKDHSENLFARSKRKGNGSKKVMQKQALVNQSDVFHQGISIQSKIAIDHNQAPAHKNGPIQPEVFTTTDKAPQTSPYIPSMDMRRSATAKAWLNGDLRENDPRDNFSTESEYIKEESERTSDNLGQTVLYDIDYTANVAVEANTDMAQVELAVMHENERKENDAANSWGLGSALPSFRAKITPNEVQSFDLEVKEKGDNSATSKQGSDKLLVLPDGVPVDLTGKSVSPFSNGQCSTLSFPPHSLKSSKGLKKREQTPEFLYSDHEQNGARTTHIITVDEDRHIPLQKYNNDCDDLKKLIGKCHKRRAKS